MQKTIQETMTWIVLMGGLAFSSVAAQTPTSTNATLSSPRTITLSPRTITLTNANHANAVWCESGTMRLTIVSDVDAETAPVDSAELSSERPWQLEIRGAESNVVVHQGELQPDTLSDAIELGTPGVYELRLIRSAVASSDSSWQKWLRLDSITHSQPAEVVKSWPLIVLPTVGNEPITYTETVNDASRSRLRSTLVHVNHTNLRDWCEPTNLSASNEDQSLLKWNWNNGSDKPIVEIGAWKRNVAMIQGKIDALIQNKVDGIVLPWMPNESDPASAKGVMLSRIAAAEMLRAGGQVWLEPRQLPCGDLASHAIESWMQSWAQTKPSGFVVHWQINRTQCRQCGHQHGAASMRPIIANRGDHRLIIVQPAHVASDPNETAAWNRLRDEATLDSRGTAGAVAWVDDWRCPPSPQIRSNFPVTMTRAAVPGDGVWLGSLAGRKQVDDTSVVSKVLPSDVQITNQWFHWWEQVASRPESSADSTSVNESVALIVDESMLASPTGQVARAVWMNGTSDLQLVLGNDPSQSLMIVLMQPSTRSMMVVNPTPWPVELTLAMNATPSWRSEWNGSDWMPSKMLVPLSRPEPSRLGTVLQVGPRQMVLCQCDDALPTKIAWTDRLVDANVVMPTITDQVTRIVEHVGLLSEPDRLTRRIGAQPSPVRDDSGATESAIQRWKPSRVLQASSTLLRPQKNGKVVPTNKPGNPSLLLNGGFEQSRAEQAETQPDMDWGIPHWTHAQHPADSVTLDSRSAWRGQNSVRLAARNHSGTQPWLISKNIDEPLGGRLSVSMAVRGMRENATDETESGTNRNASSSTTASTAKTPAANPAPMLSLRVAIEGAIDGHPCRHSQVIEIPPNGKWRDSEIVLEWLDLSAPGGERIAEDLRVTIDNLSDGTVWVDEIFVTDWFASRAERAEVQSLAYLAVQGLQRNDIRASAKLLNHFWAQELLNLASDRQVDPRRAEVTPRFGQPAFGTLSLGASSLEMAGPASGVNPSSTGKTTVGAAVAPADDPGVARRIRNWLPEPLRF